MKTELSKRNPYRIKKHRYLELKHFCLQYPLWKRAYHDLDGLAKKPREYMVNRRYYIYPDPTANCAVIRANYSEKMRLIEETAQDTDEVLASYILVGVTEGRSYDYLSIQLGIPCCKDVYYNRYRKFFWLLNKSRK